MGRFVSRFEYKEDYYIETEVYECEGSVMVRVLVFKGRDIVPNRTFSTFVCRPNFFEVKFMGETWESKIDRKIRKNIKKAKAWVLYITEAENAVFKISSSSD